MKCCGHRSSLPDYNRIAAFSREGLDAIADVNDLWSADKNHFERRFPQSSVVRIAGPVAREESALTDRAVDLASVGVAADADVESAESFLRRILHFGGQQDGARAGAEGRLGANELLEPFESPVAEELQERAGFASGDDEAIDVIKLLGLPDKHNFSAQLFEPFAMSVKIALEGQNTDSRQSKPFTTADTEGAEENWPSSLWGYSNGCGSSGSGLRLPTQAKGGLEWAAVYNRAGVVKRHVFRRRVFRF